MRNLCLGIPNEPLNGWTHVMMHSPARSVWITLSVLTRTNIVTDSTTVRNCFSANKGNEPYKFFLEFPLSIELSFVKFVEFLCLVDLT
jgi:hypothetical protein